MLNYCLLSSLYVYDFYDTVCIFHVFILQCLFLLPISNKYNGIAHSCFVLTWCSPETVNPER